MTAALQHPKSQGLSDRQIADHIGVGHATVGEWRKKLSVQNGQIPLPTRTVTRNGSTYQQNVSNIGRAKSRLFNNIARTGAASRFFGFTPRAYESVLTEEK